ncbi:MAG: hypothetical protein ACD_59C00111G0002 [uncultured bacterium]|nr:MAG: hypothetical protein ACD_59C00111G0002 [uncultured bacterium]
MLILSFEILLIVILERADSSFVVWHISKLLIFSWLHAFNEPCSNSAGVKIYLSFSASKPLKFLKCSLISRLFSYIYSTTPFGLYLLLFSFIFFRNGFYKFFKAFFQVHYGLYIRRINFAYLGFLDLFIKFVDFAAYAVTIRFNFFYG